MSSLLMLLACNAGTYGAPQGSAMVLPIEELTFSGGSGGLFDDEDGYGYLFASSLRVIDSNGVSMNNIEVEIITNWAGAYVLPEHAVPEVTALADDCAKDGSADACGIFLSVDGQAYAELGYVYEYLDDMRPNVMRAGTNNRGILPYYIFFDSLPSEGEFDMQFSIGVDIGLIPVTVASTQG